MERTIPEIVAIDNVIRMRDDARCAKHVRHQAPLLGPRYRPRPIVLTFPNRLRQ